MIFIISVLFILPKSRAKNGYLSFISCEHKNAYILSWNRLRCIHLTSLQIVQD